MNPPVSVSDLVGKRIHFVGIGGSGMSGIARIMMSESAFVSGCDMKINSTTQALADMGAAISSGHESSHLNEIDLVVASGAISQSNPELISARQHGIPVITRAQALALLMFNKKSVAVAGTHGKTTTTSMLTVALQQNGADPSFSIGGMINALGVNSHKGSGEIFVAEADESDGSFIAYRPFCAIITNIELDHVDHFSSLENVILAFLEFVQTIQPGGVLVACIDDAGVRTLLPRIERKDLQVITYGESEADFQISRIFLESTRSTARVAKFGKILPELKLQVPGKHNILNAVAALAAGVALGVDAQSLVQGLGAFTGSRRRFEHKGIVRDIEVIDDYGHHPTEIRVVLETAKRYARGGRVITIFQPHRYSRTQVFSDDFAKALDLADFVFILEIYPASEKSIPGVSSLLISTRMNEDKVKYEPSMISVVASAVEMASEGDVILTLGAGDVTSLAPVIVQALEEKN